MKLFVAFVVLCCALSAQGACNKDNGANKGGVLNDDGSYIPGSCLAWVDVAENFEDLADDEGKQWLQVWADASRTYDDTLKGPNQIPEVAIRAILQANQCFCNLNGRFADPAINQWYASLCTDFGNKLATGTNPEINAFMLDAYDKFNAFTC